MNSTPLFRESQRFTQPWLLIIALAITSLIIFGTYQQVVNNYSFGNTQFSNEALLAISGIMYLFSLFLLTVQFQVKIDQEKISMRYFPIQLAWQNHLWKDMEQVELMNHVPHQEFVNAPHRLRWLSGNSTYLIYGSKAYKLHFKDGRKLLVSTKKFDALKQTMEMMQVPITISEPA